MTNLSLKNEDRVINLALLFLLVSLQIPAIYLQSQKPVQKL